MNIQKAAEHSDQWILTKKYHTCITNVINPCYYTKSPVLFVFVNFTLSIRLVDTAKAELPQLDFKLAIEKLVPSASNEELRHYEKIQWEFDKNKQAEKDVLMYITYQL